MICDRCQREVEDVLKIGNQIICRSCFESLPTPKSKQQNKQMLWRWICLTHNCGSYNGNLMVRHLKKDCKIVFEATFGAKKPKTFGRWQW